MTLAGKDHEIEEAHLSQKVNAVSQRPSPMIEAAGTIQESTERLEQGMIVDALRKTGGNRSQATRMLGLTRQGLLNKINRDKIET